jgi:hypothetical protein
MPKRNLNQHATIGEALFLVELSTHGQWSGARFDRMCRLPSSPDPALVAFPRPLAFYFYMLQLLSWIFFFEKSDPLAKLIPHLTPMKLFLNVTTEFSTNENVAKIVQVDVKEI